jgi:hypothetical protein
MSASEPRPTYPFRVRVELDDRLDWLSRIRVSDGRDRPLAEADGELYRDLPPGLYPVRVERGGIITDLVLRHSAESPADRVVAAPQRSTALPTSDSTTGPSYYRERASHFSTRDTGTGPLPVSAGDDAPRLFVFVRAASREAAAGVWVGNGLELCDRNGAILSLFGEEHTEANAADGWLAFSRRLPKGFYRLRWVDPSGSRAIAVHLFERWDTQVFVPFDRRPWVERASILLPYRNEPFDPDSPDTQATDMGLLGLRSGRDLVPDEVRRELLYGKFHNPMLGLIGAHLLLLGPRPNRTTVNIVLDNLSSLLGDVPDTRALAWRAWRRLGGDQPPLVTFEEPPMLRAGLRAVFDADAEVGGLVPADGILSWISRYQRADSGWTTWSPPVQTHARPQEERPARPYLLPEQQEIVFLDTEEDLDLSRASNAVRSATRGRSRGLELALGALRSSDAWSGLGASVTGPAANRPVDALRDQLATLDLPATVTKSLSFATATLGTAGISTLGPSLSLALPQDQTTDEDGSSAWIDNLVKDALATARRTGREIEVAGLARAANLPRVVVEERITTLGEPRLESR